MKKLIVIFLILIASQSVFAQSGWVSQYQNDSLSGFTKVIFPDSINGYIFGSDEVFKTTNLGATWQRYKFTGNTFLTAEFLNKDTGYSVGKGITTLIRTVDGGQTWDSLYNFPKKITCIKFRNAFIGFVCCNESIYKTSDGGISWNLVLNAFYVNSQNHSIIFTDSLVGYMCSPSEIFIPFSTYQTIVYKTSDGGNSWSNISFLSNTYLTQMKFVNANTGYASASYNGVYKTTNAGVSWFQLFYVAGRLNCIEIISPSKIYIPGFVSSNSGINWYPQNYQNIDPVYFKSIYFINNSTGFIVGGRPYNSTPFAFLLKTTDGGGVISGINISSNIIPDKYSLSQNYPNPFNPSTKINYEVKSSGFVSLKIFDLLGKEVASLVNEKQNAGSYVVDFNSNEFNLPSGIYFYTLNAGEFKETRKMVLVK